MTEIFDNIRGLYDFSLPVEPLRPFIEFFSESSPGKTSDISGGKPFTIKMFPSWTPTIWINLGTPYKLSTGQSQQHIPRDSDILVLRDVPTIRHNRANDHIFTIKFFPGGLEAILGVNQTTLTGRVVSLRQILPLRLLHDLKMAPSPSHRISIIQDHFLAAMRHRPFDDHYSQLIRASIGEFESGKNLNTTQLAQRYFVHSRTINRYFHRVVGLPPKKYFSILRARAALTSYLADRPNFSPETFGYYDASHFYKAIRQFTGRGVSSGT